MGTLRKNVQFKGHAGFIQGICEPQGILHRHRGIVPGVKQEGGRGFRGDGLIQGGDGKGEDPAHAFQDAGIPQNQGVGPVSCQSTGSGRQVAPAEKPQTAILSGSRCHSAACSRTSSTAPETSSRAAWKAYSPPMV